MFFHQRFIPGLAIASYIIGDEEQSREAAVIDPTRDVEEYIRIAKAEGLRITHILETHVHADFVSGAVELKARLGGAPQIHCSAMGGKEWTPPYADVQVRDGDEFHLGQLRVRAVHTPGHTFEHLTWAIFDESRSADTPWLMLTGDFLFVGDVGRPDLLGEGPRKQLAAQLYRSVFEKLPPLPDFTEIFPGHGAGSLCGKALGSRRSSTLGYERRFNPSLQAAPEAAWIASLLEGMPLAPPYFLRMKKVNAEGPRILGPELPGKRRFTAKEVHERVCEHCVILDVRSKEAFAGGHIPDSINIPLGPSFASWCGWVLPYDTPMLIVPDDPADVPEVVTHLLRVGFDDVQGYLEDGVGAWETNGFPLARLETISAQDLAQKLAGSDGERPFVLDVRTDAEWSKGHIAGALHIHGGLIQERHGEVPRERAIAVVCGSGYRASIAASFLKREGHLRAMNLLGGMSAWNASGQPTTRSDK